MAGEFDDLVPGGGGAAGGGAFDDLVPAPTPEAQRAERLRKMALASMHRADGQAGASDLFNDAYTFGLMKPVGALAGALGGEAGEWLGGEPASFGERWTAQTGAYDDYLKEASDKSGWGGTAASLAGSVTGGLGHAAERGVVTAAQQPFWRWMAEQAGLGAVQGAAENSNDWGSALVGGAEGAGISAGVGGALRGLGRFARWARPTQADRLAARGNDPGVIRSQGRDLYRQLDDAGVAFSDAQSGTFADAVHGDLVNNGWDPQGAHAQLNGVLGRIEALRGRPVSLETLQQIREQLGSNASGMDPQVRRIAGRVMNQLDGFVRQEMPAMSNIPGDQVGPMWQQARQLWRTASVADDMNWRLDKAASRSARTNSGTNIENPIRQNIGSVLDRSTQPGRFNPYSEEELAQMRRTVEGTRVRNFLRGVGNRFGGSGPMALNSDLGLGGAAGMSHVFLGGAEPSTGMLTGLGVGAGLWGMGKAARMGADRMAQDEADTLVRLITTGSRRAPELVQRAGPPTRATLARLMSGQSLARGAGLSAAGQL